ncbi:MAG: hypothetical protein ACSHXB_16130 [Sulfitobacter sp.]
MRLAAFSKVFPEQSIAVEDCVIAAGHQPLEAKAFRRIFGINEVRKWTPEFNIADVLPKLFDDMQKNQDAGASPPDTFIYVHACPLHAMSAADPLETLQSLHPFLANVDQVYEMDQNCCAGLFWALEAAQNMLKRGTTKSVAIVAGESFSDLPTAERYMPACTILGDAFTGIMVDAKTTGTQISDIVLHSNPDFHFGLYATDKEVHAFNRAQVRLTSDVLDEMGFEPTSGEPILPHNINSFTWDQYCATSGAKRDDIWLNLLAEYGHCCCTDAFLNVDRFQADSAINSAVLVGVGQGGFVGACRMNKPAQGGVHATG